jgi:undecaprenyl-phosphate 4-deoxy-4-formamido-L-arabinose transferase
MTPDPDLSIVVPVFNSERTLPVLLTELLSVAASMNVHAEVLFVDDGSTDDSWRVISAMKADHAEAVRGIRLARNVGQQAATYCGLLEARGRWVATIDDDLQPHPRELRKLWDHAHASGSDVVYGVYAALHHTFLHRAGSRVFRMLLRRMVPRFPDGSSFRLIRSVVTKSIPRHIGPWILVDPVLAWHTSDISSVVVEHQGRASGRSGYTLPALVAIACRLLFTYSTIPLRLMTAVGFLSAIVSFGLGLYFLFQKLTVGAQIGFSALIVTTTFASGVILVSLGILGEYISRIHTMGSGEPAFTIKARTDC